MTCTNRITDVSYTPYANQVADILGNMNWDSLQKTMRSLDWQWDFENPPATRKVPSVGHLVHTAKKILEKAATLPDPAVVSFGGLRALKINGKLSLMFTVQSYTFFEEVL